MRKILIIVLTINSFLAIAQENELDISAKLGLNNVGRPIHFEDPTKLSVMQRYEDSLSYFVDSITYTQNFTARKDGNIAFIKIIKNMLKQPACFAYPFDSLKNSFNILNSPDGKFRIYNWMVYNEIDMPRYYGVIQLENGKLLPMVDVNDQILRQQEDSVLKDGKWFGALYYNIIAQKIKNSTVYFLMGFNGTSDKSDKKIVEALQFDGNGNLQFGMPIFESMVGNKMSNGKVVNRFIAEYQKNSKIRLNWDAEQNMIVYDHLESSIGDNAKRYTFVSDGTYDGLKFNGRVWQIVPNAIPFVNTPDGSLPGIQNNLQSKIIKD